MRCTINVLYVAYCTQSLVQKALLVRMKACLCRNASVFPSYRHVMCQKQIKKREAGYENRKTYKRAAGLRGKKCIQKYSSGMYIYCLPLHHSCPRLKMHNNANQHTVHGRAGMAKITIPNTGDDRTSVL